ncbi:MULTISPECIES: hypothetical protein [Alteromonas]|jgi:cellulose-binding protein|uniref:Cellulose-binding Sde182 C-terminal domain-containing protein n=3 Tax=Alteromonas mediterranea TaxID=314275 RepID=S5AJ98_9ALTE|nr:MULTISPECIES: hypothetical protein [Alteromonas]AGP79061.1 hypothetical protein I633_16790 [Alteromonas mediterranea 615]AGP94823.1 hypothetical protein I634_15640 [Alteromonas mediterranea U8]MEA3382881.1 hypothetical protein [Pseudomonadota bacterium]AFV86735.1 periplasmic protein [Alteromonas mediterranea DE1]AGP86864.1 hypothetical protein I607_15395 [Alteromonas mediterranea U4]
MTSRAVTSLSRIQFAFCLICMWSFIPLAVAEVEERWQPLNQKPRLLVLTDIEADPDGDALQFYWFNYAEAGTMKDQTVKIHSAENMARVHVVAPDVEKPQSIHFILKLTDRGEPH